jgi:hypothetical protein
MAQLKDAGVEMDQEVGSWCSRIGPSLTLDHDEAV